MGEYLIALGLGWLVVTVKIVFTVGYVGGSYFLFVGTNNMMDQLPGPISRFFMRCFPLTMLMGVVWVWI